MRVRQLLEMEERSILSVMGQQPEVVEGDFSCSNNQLTSLQGAPSSVGGYFSCSSNKLTSLQGAPSSVGGGFSCEGNRLTSLQGAPSSVGGGFYCNNNQLTSLQGAPSSVGGQFRCTNNQLTSLAKVHHRIKQINGWFYAPGNPITSHVLGLFLIKGITKVSLDNKEVEKIINKHLPSQGPASMNACAEELIEAGFEEYAQL